MYMKLMIYLISNEQGMKREEAAKYYVENVICPDFLFVFLCNEMIHG